MRDTPAWATALAEAIDVFARANARVWDELAAEAPEDRWKRKMSEVTREWAESRRGTARTSR